MSAANKKEYIVYVAECKEGKYYVGRTSRSMEERLKEHKNGSASSWTQMYPIVRIIEESKGDKWTEDAKTYQAMESYGIDNVRGGSYTQIKLSDAQRSELQTKFKSVNNLCYLCGKGGHFASKCRSKTVAAKGKFKVGSCFRCGAISHFAPNCYAKKDINGKPLS
jgi:predicted GIY-YIG superfamily endonuclease